MAVDIFQASEIKAAAQKERPFTKREYAGSLVGGTVPPTAERGVASVKPTPNEHGDH